jgi:hypothetical protein
MQREGAGEASGGGGSKGGGAPAKQIQRPSKNGKSGGGNDEWDEWDKGGVADDWGADNTTSKASKAKDSGSKGVLKDAKADDWDDWGSRCVRACVRAWGRRMLRGRCQGVDLCCVRVFVCQFFYFFPPQTPQKKK